VASAAKRRNGGQRKANRRKENRRNGENNKRRGENISAAARIGGGRGINRSAAQLWRRETKIMAAYQWRNSEMAWQKRQHGNWQCDEIIVAYLSITPVALIGQKA